MPTAPKNKIMVVKMKKNQFFVNEIVGNRKIFSMLYCSQLTPNF